MPSQILSKILSATIALLASTSALQLHPLPILNYEAAVGLHQHTTRDPSSDFNNFADFALQDRSQLLYHGVSGTTGQHHLANLTIYAPNGVPMITMERFEGRAAAVECKAADGIVSVTFRSEDAWRFAVGEWGYVNDDVDEHFLLIGNHVGCGMDGDRRPYLVSSISEDIATLTTHMTAQPLPWSDVAGTYDLHFGHLIPMIPDHSRRKTRDLVHCLDGDCTPSGSFSIPFSIGKKGSRSRIFHDSVKVTVGTYSVDRFTLDCISCYTTGSFAVTGTLTVKDYAMTDFTMTVSPHDVTATFELEATLAASDKPDRLNKWKKETWKMAVPDAGISVGTWLNVGATIHNEVGCGISFKGSATVTFGVALTVPNHARATLDACDLNASRATGWGGEESIKPMADIRNASGSVVFEVFDRPKLVFGVEVRDVEKFDLSLQLKLPQLTQSLEAAYDATGLCSRDAGALTTGVKAETNVGLSLDVVGEVGIGKVTKGPKTQATINLYHTAYPIATACVPLFMPALIEAAPTASPDGG